MIIISIARSISAFIILTFIKTFKGVDAKYTYRNHIGKNVRFLIDRGARIMLGKDIGLRDNVCITVRKDSSLVLGDNVFLNNGCQLIAHNHIELGDNVRCGQNTMFFDHDYDFRTPGAFVNKKYRCSPIVVGSGTWIGAGCIILRGTIIGRNCVIGAGSVLKGTIPDNSVVIQNRETEILGIDIE